MTATERTRKRLSTGHEVELPLELEFAMGGVVVPARRTRLEAILPNELSSLAIAPGVGCVALVGIQYHRVGGGDRDATGLEPYDEFAVVVPTVHGSRTTVPFAQLAGGTLGGHVHWLPVTTEPAVALGREIWGFPKDRTDLTVTVGADASRTVVRSTSGGVVRLEVSRPLTSARAREWTFQAFTTKDGALLRATARIRGEIAVGLGSSVGTSLELAPALATELGVWNQPIARLHGSRIRAHLCEGEPRDR